MAGSELTCLSSKNYSPSTLAKNTTQTIESPLTMYHYLQHDGRSGACGGGVLWGGEGARKRTKKREERQEDEREDCSETKLLFKPGGHENITINNSAV